MPSEKTQDQAEVFDLTSHIESLRLNDKVIFIDEDGNRLGSAKNQPDNIVKEIHGHVRDIVSSFLKGVKNVSDLRIKMEILLHDMDHVMVSVRDNKISAVALGADPSPNKSN